MKQDQDQLFDAVYRAAGRADVRDAVRWVYDRLQREIDERRPVCNMSGRCCRFEEFGHRLYVTTIELAAFVYELTMRSSIQKQGEWEGSGCPFQASGRCGVHEIRPFGCRIFFCDETATEWQQQQYECLHSDLKRLHEDLDVPYFYMEWREALRALQLVAVQDVGRADPL